MRNWFHAMEHHRLKLMHKHVEVTEIPLPPRGYFGPHSRYIANDGNSCHEEMRLNISPSPNLTRTQPLPTADRCLSIYSKTLHTNDCCWDFSISSHYYVTRNFSTRHTDLESKSLSISLKEKAVREIDAKPTDITQIHPPPPWLHSRNNCDCSKSSEVPRAYKKIIRYGRILYRWEKWFGAPNLLPDIKFAMPRLVCMRWIAVKFVFYESPSSPKVSWIEINFWSRIQITNHVATVNGFL